MTDTRPGAQHVPPALPCAPTRDTPARVGTGGPGPSRPGTTAARAGTGPGRAPRRLRGAVEDPVEAEHLRAGLGATIVEQRAAADLTQADLARLAHCSPDTVASLETGRRRPSITLLGLLAAPLCPQDPAGMHLELMDAAGPSLRPSGRRRRARHLHPDVLAQLNQRTNP